MDKQFTQKRTLSILRQAVGLGAGGVIGWFLGKNANQDVGFLELLSLFAIAVVVHEVGHVIGALAVNFRVCSFIVGPITIHWNGRRPSIRWGTLTIGGMVSFAPRGIHDLRRRMLTVTAAGPAASFLGGALAVLASAIMPASSSGAAVKLAGLISCGLGLVSLIPTRRFYFSDGAKIWDLVRAKGRGERQCALLALLAALNAGTRPRDWDAGLIDRLLAFQDGSGQDVSCYLYAFWWAKDRRDFNVAQRYLEAAIELWKICPPVVKSSIAVDAAFFYSAIRGDSAAGRKWLDQCKRRLVTDRYFLLMADSAVFLSEGKAAEAHKLACEAIKALPKARFAGFAIAARDWLDAIADAAQHGRNRIETSALAATTGL